MNKVGHLPWGWILGGFLVGIVASLLGGNPMYLVACVIGAAILGAE